jgi:hypothetical protein
MITIKAKTIRLAAKQAFLDLYRYGKPNASDSQLFKEDVALIEVASPTKGTPAFVIERQKFQYVGEYVKYVPDAPEDLVDLEREHYTGLLLESGYLDNAENYLRQAPGSRRNLVDTWMPDYIDPTRQASPCLTQLFFRLRDTKLELHAHFRANDAYKLLLMDLELVACVQVEMARRLGVTVGMYIQFIDSLHFYKRDLDAINAQRSFLLSSPAWQTQE